jgi:hypothetical protein
MNGPSSIRLSAPVPETGADPSRAAASVAVKAITHVPDEGTCGS